MKVFEQIECRRNWSEDERLLLDQVDRLVEDVIAPNAAHVDESGEVPWENIGAINRLGLNTIFIPEAYGGSPMSFRLYLAVVRRISEACASTGIIYATNFHAMKPVIEFGSEEQKARLLPCIAEGGQCSAASGPNTSASVCRQGSCIWPCGGSFETCCAADQCTGANTVCVTASETCMPCGGSGQPPCH